MLKSIGAEGDFGYFRSLTKHADGTYQPTRYDFLLVFHSHRRSRYNHCRVISGQSQQIIVPKKQNNQNQHKNSRHEANKLLSAIRDAAEKSYYKCSRADVWYITIVYLHTIFRVQYYSDPDFLHIALALVVFCVVLFQTYYILLI